MGTRLITRRPFQKSKLRSRLPIYVMPAGINVDKRTVSSHATFEDPLAAQVTGSGCNSGSGSSELKIECKIFHVPGLALCPGATTVVCRTTISRRNFSNRRTNLSRNLVGHFQTTSHIPPHRARRKGIPNAPLFLGVRFNHLHRCHILQTKPGKIVSITLNTTRPLIGYPAGGKLTHIKWSGAAEKKCLAGSRGGSEACRNGGRCRNKIATSGEDDT